MSLHVVLDPNAPPRLPPKLCALGIMTKAPKMGKVKTRLSPPLTPEEAAQLNICFLRDLSMSILRASEQAPARGVGIYTPPGAEAVYENILPREFVLLLQRGDSLNERLIHAVQDLFKVGFESVCLINSDSPTAPPSSFAEAANELAKPGDRIVLGPSEDGGYYLIGLKQQHVHVFEEIDWSTDRVFKQTQQRAADINVALHELPKAFDVDDPATLAKLCDELFGRNASGDVAVETRRFLNEIIEREGRERIWPT